MCSTTFGPGDLAILGDVADEQQRAARLLGEADQRLSRRTDLTDGARRCVERISPQGLDRVDHDEVRPADRPQASR